MNQATALQTIFSRLAERGMGCNDAVAFECNTTCIPHIGGGAFAPNFPEAATAGSGERAIGGIGDVQQGKYLALEVRQRGVEQLHGMAGLGEAVALGEAEQA